MAKSNDDGMKKASITPNPARMLEITSRLGGYDIVKVVGELVDNSIDAGSKQVRVWLRYMKGQPQVIVGDNGRGIPINKFVDSLRFGSQMSNGPTSAKPLGRFGFGLPGGPLNIGNVVTILSHPKGHSWKKLTFDRKKLEKSQKWEIDSPQELDENDWMLVDQMSSRGKDVPGTIVIVSDLTNKSLHNDASKGPSDNINTSQAHDALSHDLGRMYYRFIRRGLKIIIGDTDQPIEAYDPLFWDHRNEFGLTKDKDDFGEKTFRVKDSDGISHSFTVRHIWLPVDADPETAEAMDIRIENSMFNMYRNDREISAGVNLGIHRHSLNNFLRLAVDFGDDMDDMFKTTVNKTDSAHRQIHPAVYKIIKDYYADQSKQMGSDGDRRKAKKQGADNKTNNQFITKVENCSDGLVMPVLINRGELVTVQQVDCLNEDKGGRLFATKIKGGRGSGNKIELTLRQQHPAFHRIFGNRSVRQVLNPVMLSLSSFELGEDFAEHGLDDMDVNDVNRVAKAIAESISQNLGVLETRPKAKKRATSRKGKGKGKK